MRDARSLWRAESLTLHQQRYCLVTGGTLISSGSFWLFQVAKPFYDSDLEISAEGMAGTPVAVGHTPPCPPEDQVRWFRQG